ncbi:hypothetical protein GW17_00016522 [Ensete ventricosum]|nr:hypothetical protein GW17_00016522 [Ensete ventricosum]
MIEKMGYAVSYIVGNEKDTISLDLRPSDAINMAVRCKVCSSSPNSLKLCDVDRPDGQPCLEAEEFGLIRNMLIAAVEERYRDAGKTFSVERPASSAQIQEKELDMTGLNGTIHLLVLLTYT